MTMSYVRIALCTMALLCAPLASVSYAAALLSADQGSGYAGLILEKVAKTWQAPQYPSDHTVRIQVRIDGDGAVLSCAPVQSSNLALMDKSACAAVRETKKYPPPPYGMPIDVYLTFWTGMPSVGTLGASPEDPAMAAQATRNEKQASTATAAAMALARAAESRAAAAAAKGGAKNPKVSTGAVSPGTSLSTAGTPPATPVTAAGTTKTSAKENAAKAKALAAEAKNAKSTSVPMAGKDTAQPKINAQTFRAEVSPPPVPQTKQTPSAPVATAVSPVPSVPAPTPPALPEGRVVTPTPAKPLPEGRVVTPTPAKPLPEGRVVMPIPAAPSTSPASASASKLFKSGQPQSNLVGPKAEEPTGGEGRYAHLVRWTIREAMIIPAELPVGVYTFTISVRLSEKGEILKAELSYPSGNALMDKYGMQAIKRVQAIPPPPTTKLHDLHLTFIVQRS